jgi:hypothetical protein
VGFCLAVRQGCVSSQTLGGGEGLDGHSNLYGRRVSEDVWLIYMLRRRRKRV